MKARKPSPIADWGDVSYDARKLNVPDISERTAEPPKFTSITINKPSKLFSAKTPEEETWTAKIAMGWGDYRQEVEVTADTYFDLMQQIGPYVLFSIQDQNKKSNM